MKNFPISRQGQLRNEKYAKAESSKDKQISVRQAAIDANITDKKFTLFNRNKPVINWNTIEILQKWMFELDNSGLGTFIHYNEEGLISYQEQKAL